MNIATLVALGLLVLLCACAHPKHYGGGLIIPPACLTGPVTLSGCDFSSEPPKCSKSVIKYRNECAVVQAGER